MLGTNRTDEEKRRGKVFESGRAKRGGRKIGAQNVKTNRLVEYADYS